MNDLTVREETAPLAIHSPIPLLDSAKFTHMGRIAMGMARASLIPDHLKVINGNRLDVEATAANCLMIVNQAVAWELDPLAVAQCTSLVYGRLCYEGKLIAAVLEKRLGYKLEYAWSGEEGADDYAIRIWDPKNPEHVVTGTVGEWKTKEKSGATKANWVGSNTTKQLKYRGDREFARMWEPGLLLGVYTLDEFDDFAHDDRARRAKPVSDIAGRLSGPQTGGFDPTHVASEIGVAGGLDADMARGGPIGAEAGACDLGVNYESEQGEQPGEAVGPTPSESPSEDGSSSDAPDESGAAADEQHGGSAPASADISKETADQGAPRGAPDLSAMPLSVRFREGMKRAKDKAEYMEVFEKFGDEYKAATEEDRKGLESIARTRAAELRKAGKWDQEKS